MGVIDAPPWLLPAFVRTCLAAGATAPREEVEAAGLRLIRRWQEPGRHFHDLRHVVDVLARVDELAEETHRPDVVRLAAWYHGAVFSSAAGKAYAHAGGEDESASAELARDELTALGLPAAVTDRVHRLIVNLRRHDADPADVDCLALCDADLATLAVEPQRYEDYRHAVREEYAHIPMRDYLAARIAILSRLLDRRNLFLSPMGARWEDAARENLTAELNRLRSKLAALGDAEDDTTPPNISTTPATGTVTDPPTVSLPAGADDPDAGAPAPVESVEARVLRAPEPRPSSLETDPEELGIRRTARPAGTTDPDRLRRVERARIAEQGRARVERAMRDRSRVPREPGRRGAPDATASTALPPGVSPEASPPPATPLTAPTPADAEPPVPSTDRGTTPPDGSRSSARAGKGAVDEPVAADGPEPPRQDGRAHGMERTPELLEPAHRRRLRERRAPQRPTDDGDEPRSTASQPRRRRPGRGA